MSINTTAKVPRYEQETSIIYNQEDKTASIYTHNPTLIRKLDKGCEAYPLLYKFICENNVGGRTYIIPKKNVRVGLPIVKKPMTDEQKENAKIRLQKARENK